MNDCEFGEKNQGPRGRLVHVQQSGELARMLALRERVVVVHRAVAAAGLQNAMIDAGDGHLRNHQLGRTDDLLHPDRHVLNVVVVALPCELEPAQSSDAEIHVGETRPRVVAGTKQHRRLDLGAVAHAKRARGGTRDALLQILEMDRSRCVT